MARLEIRLLGGFELAREGQVLEQLPLRAARSLFAYLALNRERPHTRDLLAGIFWPDFDESRARRRLSQALWQIQTTLGEPDGQRFILGSPDTIRFNTDAPFWLDVEEFDRLIAAGDPESISRAADLYRGELLAGFYDDWLFPEQDRLRSAFLAAVDRLVDVEMGRGDHEKALLHARRLAQEDEFDEKHHRRVMRLAVLLGRHNEALRQFEECRTILAEELGTRPSPETIALYEATLADRDAGGRAVPPPEESPLFEEVTKAPFIGRDAERSRFAARLDGALDGAGGVVLLEGESGVGKTRLLAEVVEDARWRGMDVLWGRSAASGGRPFGPLAHALAGITGLRARQLTTRIEPAWRHALAPLAPEIGGEDIPDAPMPRADEQARMREAIGMAFRGVAAITPTLVVLEDVHWSDEDTIAALAQLAGQVADDRILFAVSYRHGEAREREDVWTLLRSLDRMAHCERISLAAYSPAQTEELIRRSLGRTEVSREFSERVHRDTGGVPLFIVETLRALYERDDLGAAERDTEEPTPARDRLPLTPTVHALIRHRLDALDAGTRRTLELVSADDGGLSLTEIVAASDLDDPAALSAVDDLVRRRLLDTGGGAYTVNHDLMRRVVYDDLPLSRRLDLHRRVAFAIEASRPDEVELLAHHFLAARMPDRAADYLEQAARRAMAVHAYDMATIHLERAAAALDEIAAAPERRFAVAAMLDEVLDVLGNRDEQRIAVERMERFARGPQRSDALTRKAWWQAHQDQFGEAVATAEQALAVARESGDPGRIVAALTALGMIACYCGKAAEGVEYLEQAADFRGVDRRQEADARNALGQNLVDLQRFGEAESQLLAALAIYAELEDARGQAEVLGMLGILNMERGATDSATSAYRRAIDTSRRIGYRHGEAVNLMNLAILLVFTNQLGEALRMFDASAATYTMMGNARGSALVDANAAWMRHSRLGLDHEAQTAFQRALSVFEAIGDQRGVAQCIGALASITARNGDFDAAWPGYEQAIAMAVEFGDQWLRVQFLREYANTRLIAGQPERSLTLATEAEAICREIGLEDQEVAVTSLRGRALLALGRNAEALEATTAAIEGLHDGLELSYLVHHSHGRALHAMGQHGESHHHFSKAYEELMQIVATLDPDDRELALRSVPDHSEILDWWASEKPVTVVTSAAAASAPTGRPLRSDETIRVALTVSRPEDLDIPDRVERRKSRMIRVLGEAEDQGASLTVGDLAEVLNASEATIRRDLGSLRAEGRLVTTRGSRSA